MSSAWAARVPFTSWSDRRPDLSRDLSSAIVWSASHRGCLYRRHRASIELCDRCAHALSGPVPIVIDHDVDALGNRIVRRRTTGLGEGCANDLDLFGELGG